MAHLWSHVALARQGLRSWSREVTRVGNRVPVLDLEPELGELLPQDDLDEARTAALVVLHDLPAGPWEPAPESAPSGGFLIVHGCLSRDVAVLREAIATDFVVKGTSPTPHSSR